LEAEETAMYTADEELYVPYVKVGHEAKAMEAEKAAARAAATVEEVLTMTRWEEAAAQVEPVHEVEEVGGAVLVDNDAPDVFDKQRVLLAPDLIGDIDSSLERWLGVNYPDSSNEEFNFV
jgi:hypothetical protein